MKNNQKYIVRCDRAGVFYAEIAERRSDEADLVNARRVYYWDGAATISELAVSGVKRKNSKITLAVPSMTVLGVCEVIPCSPEACKSLDAVPVWTA